MDFSPLVGLPWRDRGRGSDGLDCWGLVVVAFSAGTGIRLPSYADDYQSAADHAETSALFAEGVSDWVKVDTDKAQPFDVAVFLTAGRFHVGLMVRRGLVLHIPVRKTSVIVPLGRVTGVLDGIYRHSSKV
jgi:cell wall-associated NlpC family hydrolase